MEATGFVLVMVGIRSKSDFGDCVGYVFFGRCAEIVPSEGERTVSRPKQLFSTAIDNGYFHI